MSSTKILKNAAYEQLPHNMMDQRLFTITKTCPPNFISPNITNLNPPVPNPIQRTNKKKEEEKVGGNLANKENKNICNIKPINFIKEVKKSPKKLKAIPKVEKPIIIEKEVKLDCIEGLNSNELNEPYNDERVALEDEYGLDQDDLFDFSDLDQFETQSLHNENVHEFDQKVTHTQQISVDHHENSDSCSGLKKGIDNDAIVADLSTLDGLSLYGDMLDQLQKKCFEEEFENIDIIIEDFNSPHYEAENINHYENTMSKGHEEDLEEEKIHKPFYKSSPEKYMYIMDFKDDNYDMDFHEDFYNTPMIEESVSFQKKFSNRTERSISFFEEQNALFAEDLHQKFSNLPNRERSFSKVSEDQWYRKDWRLKHYNDQPHGMNDALSYNHKEIEEPDYFKQFNSVLYKPVQRKERIPIIYHVPDVEMETIKESENTVPSHIQRK